MKTEQLRWNGKGAWAPAPNLGSAQLVLVFGSTERVADRAAVDAARKAYPKAHVIGCSTAGEIMGTTVTDGSLVLTAAHFDGTQIKIAETNVEGPAESRAAGKRLASAFDPKGLVHVFVLSDGQKVNGSELVDGIQANLPPNVSLTGGLAGDGARFQKTLVFGASPAAEGQITALGFYGSRLRVGFGSLGGWDPFGPQRLVTKSKGNVLFELDGQPALALYKKYLGEHAAGLPATGLLFPLSVRIPGRPHEVVRTILNVNEADQSLTFAGDVPQGSHARLMKANFDRLVDGAHGAAESSHQGIRGIDAQLAILISCVGRKLVLKSRTEDELEAVRDVLGPKATMTGFYSYGEICPAAPMAGCELHNQTMTITTLTET